ncbi:MAG: NAD(P)H-binding protein [Myxococcota bacterium]
MNILLLGATGYVGRSVLSALLARGHDVVAGIRDPSRADALPAGVPVALTPLDEPDRVVAAANNADTVVSTAFPGHGLSWPDAVAVERTLHEAWASELRGTRLIVSNGTIFLGDSGSESLDESRPVQPDHPAAGRAANVDVLRAAGLPTVELRLASFVYGHGGSVFVPLLCQHAARTGRSIQVGSGEAILSAVHVDDAALAYVAAIEGPEASGIYHVAADERPRAKDLARAIAEATDAQVVEVDEAQAQSELDPFTTQFLSTNNHLASNRIRQELTWRPQHGAGLLWEVAHGSYRDRQR